MRPRYDNKLDHEERRPRDDMGHSPLHMQQQSGFDMARGPNMQQHLPMGQMNVSGPPMMGSNNNNNNAFMGAPARQMPQEQRIGLGPQLQHVQQMMPAQQMGMSTQMNMGGIGTQMGMIPQMGMASQMNMMAGVQSSLMGNVPTMGSDNGGIPHVSQQLITPTSGGLAMDMNQRGTTASSVVMHSRSIEPKESTGHPDTETFGLSRSFLSSLNINLPLVKEILVLNVSIYLVTLCNCIGILDML